ncbi:MAG TPA: DMT family transporter [Acidimicrobiales bacterium]|nr:DMT family transporter [Acidimicrobiales bacterium]
MARRGVVLFAAMSVIWGIPYLLIKVAVRELSPDVLVFCRTAIGAALLVPVAAARHQLRPVLVRWRPLLAYTVVELAGPWLLLSTAEQRLDSSLTALLIAGVPMVGAVLAWSLGERGALGRRGVAGLIVGLAGVGALVGFDVSGGDLPSVAMMVVVAVGYAVGPAIFARRLGGVPPLGVAAASLGICAVGFAPVAALHLPETVPSARVVLAVAVLGVVCTALAFLVFFALIAELGPVRAMVFTYVNPAVAVVLGVAFLGEGFGPATAVGFVLVLAGSFLATSGRRTPSGAAAPAVAVAEP